LMSNQFPNSKGISDIFQYQASLEQGKNLHDKRDVFGTSLEIRIFRNANNYLTSISSWHTHHAGSRWDGDGTQAPALDITENLQATQFTQEIRYTFSRLGRLNGSFGANYWREKVRQTNWFGINEQYMAWLILKMPRNLITENGSAFPVTILPVNPLVGSLAGTPLPSKHEEDHIAEAVNQSADLFLDATRRVSRRLSFMGGIRGTYETFQVSDQRNLLGDTTSTLGMLTGKYPNLFFKPAEDTLKYKKWSALKYRVGFQYEIQTNSSLFLSYSRGIRPHVIRFDSLGNREILNEEKLHSLNAGFKTAIASRIWIDVTGYYQMFSNFRTNAWIYNSYHARDAGRATSYGAEASFKIAMQEYLDIYGNYAYIHARFNTKDGRGATQEFAGNEFRLTPEHSFNIGFRTEIPLTRLMYFFLIPSYSWKSHIWFDDANTPQLEQNAYELLNLYTGFSWSEPAITLSISCSNLMKEKYLISAGNTGNQFGVPSFIPGPPQMFSGKITWRF
jgi:iron complex outermembrane recepter protein